MGLTLKDVYNQRRGILNFTNTFIDNVYTAEFNSMEDDFNTLTGYLKVEADLPKNVKPKWNMEDTSNDKQILKDYYKELKRYTRQMQNQKLDYLKGLHRLVESSRCEVAMHKVALDAYALMKEKYADLVAANPKNLNDPVIVESRKNIEIFKAQLLKKGIYQFEIDAAEDGDRDLDEKICKAVIKGIPEKMAELQERYKVIAMVTSKKEFVGELKNILSSENLRRLPAAGLDEHNCELYGIIKNAGYTYARNFNTPYFVYKTEIQKPYSGYEFNENNEMVEKKSTGFFSAIGNFFGRLVNKGKVASYNESLRQTKEGMDDKEALEDVEKMNQKSEIIRQEKENILVNEKFLEENEGLPEEELDAIAEYEAEHKVEIADKPAENDLEVGPGWNQLD